MPFNIEGDTHDIDSVVTKHGHLLINASQYAAVFTGCSIKVVGRKLTTVSERFSELQHGKRQLQEHDKASN